MYQEIAREWASALDSGIYERGTGWLRQTTAEGAVRFCAWGVLCELAVQAGVIPAAIRSADPSWLYEGCAAWPPREVLDWAGIDLDTHEYASHPALKVIADQNDYGYPFDVIAEAIRDAFVFPSRVLVGAASL